MPGFGALFALTIVPAITGCGSGSGSNGGSGGGTGGSGCTVDYSAYKTGPTISFKDDVLPILNFSCTASSCHNSTDKKAGLDLGFKGCKYDKSAKWRCNLVTTVVGPDGGPPQFSPLTPQEIIAIYASLTAPAQTVTSGTVLRVKAGDPAHSFIMQKLSDTENDQDYTCKSQDITRSVLPCGTFMPLSGDPFCAGDQRPRFDAIARWIQQGAVNDSP